MNPHQQRQSNRHTGRNTLRNPRYPGYNTQGTSSGYQPPAQYGNVQAGNHRSEERQAAMVKLARLDEKFDTLFLGLYQVWLWLKVIVGIIFLVAALGNPVIMIPIIMLVWNVSQQSCGSKAISQKNLAQANDACWMVCIGLVPWLIMDIFIIKILVTEGEYYGLFRLLIFVITCGIFLHVGLGVTGAFKVRRLLIERGILQEKLNEIVEAEENRELQILVRDA